MSVIIVPIPANASVGGDEKDLAKRKDENGTWIYKISIFREDGVRKVNNSISRNV